MDSLKSVILSKPQNDIIKSSCQYNLFLAGVGSGKTHNMGLKSGEFVSNFPHARGLICANTYGQLSRSTLSGIYKVWHEYYGMVEGVHYVVNKMPPQDFTINGARLNDYKNTISFINGALIWIASLDNYKAIDGIEVSYALLDETKDTKEVAVKEVIVARLRQNKIFIYPNGDLGRSKKDNNKGFNPLFIFTSPAKVQWLNEMFEIDKNIEAIGLRIFSETDYYSAIHNNKKVVIASTYHNLHNLPEDYITSKKMIWDDTPGLSDMLIYGSPISKSGGEWYSRFERDTHIKQGLEFNPNYPIHVSFDFNVVPYMPALVMQIIPTDEGIQTVRVLKEYALKSPNNTTSDVCDEIIMDYSGLAKTMYYYGDASGKNRHTAVTDKSIRHNYDVIKTKLYNFIFDGSNRVPRSNPPISGRRILINRLFGDNGRVKIEVDGRCKNFINDLEYLKEDKNGGYIKPKVNEGGVSFEKLGHHSDAFVYFCFQQYEYLIKI